MCVHVPPDAGEISPTSRDSALDGHVLRMWVMSLPPEGPGRNVAGRPGGRDVTRSTSIRQDSGHHSTASSCWWCVLHLDLL